MVFITLGSQKFQFNRLLKAIDSLIENGLILDQVFAQIGYSDYKPRHYAYKEFLDRDEFSEEIRKSDIVITHGGTGAIINALKKGKKVVAVPRLSRYGEHVDDHQLQIIDQFRDLGLICECKDVNKIDEALRIAKKTNYKVYTSNTESIIKSIIEFIEK